MGAADVFNSATVTSYRRTAATNAAVKGKPTSQHLTGTAADIVFPGNPSVWPVKAVRRLAQRHGLVLIDERNRSGYRPHLHLQLP